MDGKRRKPKESRAPYAHLVGYIFKTIWFLSPQILIIAKILHAVVLLL